MASKSIFDMWVLESAVMQRGHDVAFWAGEAPSLGGRSLGEAAGGGGGFPGVEASNS